MAYEETPGLIARTEALVNKYVEAVERLDPERGRKGPIWEAFKEVEDTEPNKYVRQKARSKIRQLYKPVAQEEL